MTSGAFDKKAVATAAAIIERFATPPLAVLVAHVLAENGALIPAQLSLPAFETFLAATETEERAAALGKLATADRSFAAAFGFALFDQASPEHDGGESGPLPTFSSRFRALVATPLPDAEAARLAMVDGATAVWINALPLAVAADVGHHFTFCTTPRGPDGDDLASLAAAGASSVTRVASGLRFPAVLLAAELHVKAVRPVIIVKDNRLVVDRAGDDDETDEIPAKPSHDLSTEAAAALDLFAGLRAVYVWHVPQCGALPERLDGVVAGCIGPLTFDSVSCAAVIAARAPRLGAPGVAALLAMVKDPRKTTRLLLRSPRSPRETTCRSTRRPSISLDPMAL